jgi:hypothetical protein
VYFGQVFTDAFYVYQSGQKGDPVIPFDPGQHSIDRRFSQFKIDGVCNRADGSTYEINREYICEWASSGWAGVTLPSLKVAGVHPRDLNERWAKWEMAKRGTYKDKMTGETRDSTTFKFLEFYPDEEACRAAEAAHYNRTADDDDAEETLPFEANAPKVDKQREVAAKFLPALWAQAAGDVTRLGELLAGNPLTSKFFDLNSPEVVELVGESV